MSSRGLWVALGLELWSRLKEPLKQPSFVIYFLLALLLGATGFWMTLAERMLAASHTDTQHSLFRALLSVFPAIGTLACVHVIIVEDSKKSLRALFVLLVFAFVSLAILSRIVYPQSETLGFTLTYIGTGFAALSWWIANADPQRFTERPDPDAPIGGSVENDPAGNTEGFVT